MLANFSMNMVKAHVTTVKTKKSVHVSYPPSTPPATFLPESCDSGLLPYPKPCLDKIHKDVCLFRAWQIQDGFHNHNAIDIV